MWALMQTSEGVRIFGALLELIRSDSELALLHASCARRSLPVLCVTLALAPLRLLSDPVLETARAWSAWREHMAESVADPQVGWDFALFCKVMTPRLC